MQTQNWAPRIGVLALALVMTGCLAGGRSRSHSPAPANGPVPDTTAPELMTPEFGPPEPLEGPALDGPAFPPSSDGEADGFDRKRHSKSPSSDPERDFAGTAPPPVRLDGPVAGRQSPQSDTRPRLGYTELPPAP